MATAQLELQRLLIGGQWTEASSGGTFERTDPFTGEPAEESFGPIVGIIDVDGPEEAVRVAERLGPLRRHGGAGGVHRAALDDGPARLAALPALRLAGRPGAVVIPTPPVRSRL
jgi:acyl-CoA reductase-like NAD-dependent aldehyde dehydrogenase